MPQTTGKQAHSSLVSCTFNAATLDVTDSPVEIEAVLCSTFARQVTILSDHE
jgi:hypothetical protein